MDSNENENVKLSDLKNISNIASNRSNSSHKDNGMNKATNENSTFKENGSIKDKSNNKCNNSGVNKSNMIVTRSSRYNLRQRNGTNGIRTSNSNSNNTVKSKSNNSNSNANTKSQRSSTSCMTSSNSRNTRNNRNKSKSKPKTATMSSSKVSDLEYEKVCDKIATNYPKGYYILMQMKDNNKMTRKFRNEKRNKATKEKGDKRVCCACRQTSVAYSGDKETWTSVKGWDLHNACKNHISNFRKKIKLSMSLVKDFYVRWDEYDDEDDDDDEDTSDDENDDEDDDETEQ